MKIPHFIKCIGFLLTLALITFSCSQDTEATFAELIIEETVVPDETTADEEEDTEIEPVIDYQKGTLTLSEDTKVALDITKGASENSTEKKTYSLKSITQPKNGKTEMNNNNEIIYAPTADYNGADSFSYTMSIQDSTETTVEQVNTFNVTIIPSKDVVDDLVTTTFETAKTISPLANDTFSEASDVTITEISLANKGTAVLNADNTITYTPNKDTTGEDQILYKTSVTNTDDTTSSENGTIKITILGTENPTGTNIKYVTTAGKSTNTGATEASAWSISHAFSTAKAGDVVYIKAGNYGAVNLVVANSGTSTNKIQFIGYKTNPGDIESTNGPTVSYEDYKNNGDKLDATVMPLLQGAFTNKIGKGKGIYLSKNNIKIKNIQLRGYNDNFIGQGDLNEFINIIASDAGDFSSSTYSGVGIRITGDNVIANNCLVINAAAEGMTFSGEYQKHSNNKVYSDNTINPTDYYYLLTSADNFEIKNPYIERIGDLEHAGHGLVLKVNATGNLINNGNIINTSLEVSFVGVNNNTFNDCFIGNKNKLGRGSILVANGAHHNTFNNAIVDFSNTGCVRFSDWKDGSNNEGDAKDAGNNNTFKNCKFTNSDAGIDFYEWEQLEGAAHDNIFQSCEFKNLDFLFRVNRPNYNNKLINCKIENVKEYVSNRGGTYEKYNLSVSIDATTTFLNNSFTTPN